jgi:hypothetical protein
MFIDVNLRWIFFITLLIISISASTALGESKIIMNSPGKIIFDEAISGEIGILKPVEIGENIYLINSSISIVCPPELFNFTNIWMNSSDKIIMGIYLSSSNKPKSNVNLSLSSNNSNLEISPMYCLISQVDNKSSLCLFEITSKDLEFGIYNMSYDLTYLEGSERKACLGSIPLGIYEMKIEASKEGEVKISFTSPYGDVITKSAKNWHNYSINGENISAPADMSYNATYSEFTLQKPHSPFLFPIVVGLVDCILTAATDVGSQMLLENKTIDQIDLWSVGEEALKSGVTSALLIPVADAAGARLLSKGGKFVYLVAESKPMESVLIKSANALA